MEQGIAFWKPDALMGLGKQDRFALGIRHLRVCHHSVNLNMEDATSKV